MKELLFDNPLPIYVVLALAEIVIAGLWHRGRSRNLAIALLVPPVLAMAFMTVGMLVVTDRQKIATALKDIAAHVERGDLRACEAYLAEDFDGYGGSRQGAIEAGEKAWKNYSISKVGLSNVKIELTGSQAKVTARSVVTYNVPGLGEGRVNLDWTVYWSLRDGQWRIIHVDDPKMAAGL
jgi:hypothetical protein